MEKLCNFQSSDFHEFGPTVYCEMWFWKQGMIIHYLSPNEIVKFTPSCLVREKKLCTRGGEIIHSRLRRSVNNLTTTRA